jgi:hypothetical protein
MPKVADEEDYCKSENPYTVTAIITFLEQHKVLTPSPSLRREGKLSLFEGVKHPSPPHFDRRALYIAKPHQLYD